jgi:hypothetical protein
MFGHALVLQIQPLNPNLPPFVIYAQRAVDRSAGHSQVEPVKYLMFLSGTQRIAIGAFATDGDGGYNVVHNEHSELHVREFENL